MEFREDELNWLTNNPKRCEVCGHLDIFHNWHCCEFCLIPGCTCKWGSMEEVTEIGKNFI